jgi:UDP-GlcNAc:undecaprenyl-phosphate GlcNAc-1-phosphate transferase
MLPQTLVHFEWEEVSLFLVSALLCCVIVLVGPRFSWLYGRAQHLQAVQATHSRPTPRAGGIAIFGALALSVAFAPSEISQPYLMFVLATAIVFFVGLAEDLGFAVPPLKRLFAVCLASLTAIFVLGVWMPRADVPGLDALMSYWIVGVPITLLVTAGVANGFNLIDGVNGLASFTAMVAAVALGLIAEQADYAVMVHLSMMLTAAILGFLMLNYPYGLIFLGDAGAYTLGFVLSWFGISILLFAPDASPWAILLTVFWPVADTLLAIYRRTRRKVATMTPDRLHVHQLVMRALEIYVLGRGHRNIANPLSTAVLAPFVIAPPIAGIIFWDQTTMAFLSVLCFAGLFFGSYSLAFPLLRLLKRRAWSPKPVVYEFSLSLVSDPRLDEEA